MPISAPVEKSIDSVIPAIITPAVVLRLTKSVFAFSVSIGILPSPSNVVELFAAIRAPSIPKSPISSPVSVFSVSDISPICMSKELGFSIPISVVKFIPSLVISPKSPLI